MTARPPCAQSARCRACKSIHPVCHFALSPAAAGMGQVVGYTVADYLLQYASRKRPAARVPASTSEALRGRAP